MNQITCKKCGTAFADTRRTCPSCGAHPRPESRSLPQRRQAVKQVDAKAQWRTLKSTALGLIISGGLSMLFNDGTLSITIMLLLYFYGYYISLVKNFFGLHGFWGTAVAVVLGCVAVIATATFAIEHTIIGAVIMVAMCILPVAQGIAFPVWNLIQYRKAVNAQ